MQWQFDRFTIELTKDQTLSASHQGDCTNDVQQLLTKHQLEKISDEDLKAELREYGAWDEKELSNRQDNEERILWIAACNIDEDCK